MAIDFQRKLFICLLCSFRCEIVCAVHKLLLQNTKLSNLLISQHRSTSTSHALVCQLFGPSTPMQRRRQRPLIDINTDRQHVGVSVITERNRDGPKRDRKPRE